MLIPPCPLIIADVSHAFVCYASILLQRITCGLLPLNNSLVYCFILGCTGRTSGQSTYSTHVFGECVAAQYEHLAQRGALKEDRQQRDVLQRLSRLQRTLKGYSNHVYLETATLHEHDPSRQGRERHTHGETHEDPISLKPVNGSNSPNALIRFPRLMRLDCVW